MKISRAVSDTEIAACFDVFKQLRPSLERPTFVACVRRMECQGFQLAYLADPEICAVAGFRLMELFATGPILYVDDLVVDEQCRSQHYGEKILHWLRDRAINNGCNFLELDSGSKRTDAHRFYRRMGLTEVAIHFSTPLNNQLPWTSD